MADPAVWQALIETGNPYLQQERQQKGLMGMMQLQEKQRELEDSQRLRQLYMSGRQPSMQEIMSVSPQLGIEMQKAQFQNMYQMQQMEKLQREQQEANAKTYAQYVGPIADTYFMDIEQGMKPEMAQQKYHSAIGNAQAELEKKHGISPTGDFRQFSPEQVLQRSVGLGVPSRYYQRQEEMQKRMMPPAMSSEQYYGGVEMTPYGAMRKPSIRQDTGFTKATAEDIGMLQQAYDAEQDPTAKQKIGGLLNQLKQQVGAGLSQSQFITPEQMPALKAEEAGAKKKAELEAEKAMTQEQRAETLSNIPDREQIESLIDKSIGSGLEQQVKGKLAPMVGMSTEALEATKQLDVIAPQLKSITKSLAGAGAISDFEQKMMADAAGAIADPNVPPAARKAAYRTFMDVMDKANNKPASAVTSLQVGHEEGGYVYKGGDPSKQSSWEKK
jgi:hypothetical protein